MLHRCNNVLKPKGINVVKIITDPDPKMFDDVLNSFVGIAAIQIGLTDVLKSVGIEPDHIIGRSIVNFFRIWELIIIFNWLQKNSLWIWLYFLTVLEFRTVLKEIWFLFFLFEVAAFYLLPIFLLSIMFQLCLIMHI